MDMNTAVVAEASCFDVCLPDGAMGCVDAIDFSSKGTPMLVVTGKHGGAWFRRRLPMSVVTESRELQRAMAQQLIDAVHGVDPR
jgi:hypothetical protein